jgi:hypothetical protein
MASGQNNLVAVFERHSPFFVTHSPLFIDTSNWKPREKFGLAQNLSRRTDLHGRRQNPECRVANFAGHIVDGHKFHARYFTTG